MAYWIHADGEDPRQGFEFQTKVAARAHLAEAECPECTGKMITFSASALEIAAWHNRERERMEAGTYQPAPWNGLDWEAGSFRFCHLSQVKPGLVAYTPDDECGVMDRQLSVRPGVYLKRFAPHLTQSEVDAYCATVRSEKPIAYHMTQDPIEIARAYLAGPRSCMTGRGEDGNYPFSLQYHPALAYGGSPDLALAYLGTLDHARVSARTVIWPARKWYARVYGDGLLAELLKRDGYVLAYGNMRDWSGARLTIHRDSNNRILCPYLDIAPWVQIERPYLVVSQMVQGTCCSARETQGYLDTEEDNELENMHCCDHCGDCEVVDARDLCDACDQSSTVCTFCLRLFWIDDRDTEWYTVEDDDRISCGCEIPVKCPVSDCDTQWFGDPRFCTDHQYTYLVCRACDVAYSVDEDRCPDCGNRPLCPETGDLLSQEGAV